MISARGLRTVLVVLVALGLAVGVAPAAQAYPDVMFEAEVSSERVVEGETLTAHSSANVECEWKHRWRGRPQTGTGEEFTSTWTAPKVNKEKVIPVHFSCRYDAEASADGAAQDGDTWTRTIDVTVVPAEGERPGAPAEGKRSGPHEDDLSLAANTTEAGAQADTSGPSVLFLVAGLLLLMTGAAAVRTARGRARDALSSGSSDS